jgi:hypothetical protein
LSEGVGEAKVFSDRSGTGAATVFESSATRGAPAYLPITGKYVRLSIGEFLLKSGDIRRRCRFCKQTPSAHHCRMIANGSKFTSLFDSLDFYWVTFLS